MLLPRTVRSIITARKYHVTVASRSCETVLLSAVRCEVEHGSPSQYRIWLDHCVSISLGDVATLASLSRRFGSWMTAASGDERLS